MRISNKYGTMNERVRTLEGMLEFNLYGFDEKFISRKVRILFHSKDLFANCQKKADEYGFVRPLFIDISL